MIQYRVQKKAGETQQKHADVKSGCVKWAEPQLVRDKTLYKPKRHQSDSLIRTKAHYWYAVDHCQYICFINVCDPAPKQQNKHGFWFLNIFTWTPEFGFYYIGIKMIWNLISTHWLVMSPIL